MNDNPFVENHFPMMLYTVNLELMNDEASRMAGDAPREPRKVAD